MRWRDLNISGLNYFQQRRTQFLREKFSNRFWMSKNTGSRIILQWFNQQKHSNYRWNKWIIIITNVIKLNSNILRQGSTSKIHSAEFIEFLRVSC